MRTFVALRESYLDVRELARTGTREWWDEFDPEWVDAVGENGQTYYRRLLNVVVPQLPAVAEKLAAGARYLDLACGLCRGPAKVAEAYPDTRVTAVDCDPYTVTTAEREMKARGLGDRFEFVTSMIEDLELPGGHDLAVITHMCDRLMVMQNGEEVERLTSAELSERRVTKPYTQNLLRASVGFSRAS